MSEVTASIVVDFTLGDSEGVLSAEIDGREDGYNNGSTSFSPGQVVYYLVDKSTNVSIIKQTTSAGRVTFVANSIEAKEEMITFANDFEASVGSPIHGGYSTKWIGKAPSGNLVKTDSQTFRIQDSNGTGVPSVAVLKVNYTVNHGVYKLDGLGSTLSGESSYQVMIVIFGET